MFKKLWNTSGVLGHLLLFRLLGWASFPSTQVLQRSRWFGGGNLAENSRWIMYQMICFSQDKPMESNLIWYIKPAIRMSERLLLVSIQSPRISLSDSSGSLFCRKSSSIPSMKLPSFEKCNKREGNAIFWVGKKGLDYRCFKCCCKKPDVFFVQPPPSSSDPACWVTWDLSARYSLQRRGQLDSSCGIFCLDTSTMDLNLPCKVSTMDSVYLIFPM